MTDIRTCGQCGAVFVPRREHARFCRVRCRARWNREYSGDPAAEASVLQWSVTADDVRAGQSPAQRRLIEEILAGLRFVRNHIGTEAGLAEFIGPGGSSARQGPITSWTWKPVTDPALASLTARGRAWELARYRAYQAHLAGQPVGETFGRAAAFLNVAVASALSTTATGAHAGR
jgi:hypothetical protein